MKRSVAMGAVCAIAVAVIAVPSEAAAHHDPATQPTCETAIEPLVDDVIARQLEELNIPGAAVSVVGGDREPFNKGYGLADVDAAIPFDASQTTVHIDSISKLVTATAVMQLVEQGAIELTANVNEYLTDFSIREAFNDEPVTMHQLLTHTAGFEDPPAGTGPEDGPLELGTYLAQNQPDRVRPPGVHSYSDYGYDLAGYIVELQSGLPFDEYVTRHIFEPLGMSGAGFAVSPRQEAQRDNPATGYLVDDNGNLTASERGFENQSPSVGVVMTTVDMGRFMQAHLNGGEWDGERILHSDTVAMMHTAQFTQDGRLFGIGYPVYHNERAGLSILGHSGDGGGSHSMITFVPECDLGFFVTYNGDGHPQQPLFTSAAAARQELRNTLIDAIGDSGAKPQPQPDDNMEQYTGTYRWTKFEQNDPLGLISRALVPVELTVTHNADGTLTTTGWSSATDGTSLQWYPTGDGAFHNAATGEDMAFSEVAGQTIVSTSYNHYLFVFTQVAWYDSTGLHVAVAGIGLLVMLSVVVWPAAAVYRAARVRLSQGAAALPARQRGPVIARIAAGLTPIPMLLSIVMTLSTLSPAASAAAFPAAIAMVGIAATIVYTALAWKRTWWNVVARTHLTTVALGTIAFFGVAFHYQFFGLGI